MVSNYLTLFRDCRRRRLKTQNLLTTLRMWELSISHGSPIVGQASVLVYSLDTVIKSK